MYALGSSETMIEVVAHSRTVGLSLTFIMIPHVVYVPVVTAMRMVVSLQQPTQDSAEMSSAVLIGSVAGGALALVILMGIALFLVRSRSADSFLSSESDGASAVALSTSVDHIRTIQLEQVHEVTGIGIFRLDNDGLMLQTLDSDHDKEKDELYV
jgi:hypothetical protein